YSQPSGSSGAQVYTIIWEGNGNGLREYTDEHVTGSTTQYGNMSPIVTRCTVTRSGYDDYEFTLSGTGGYNTGNNTYENSIILTNHVSGGFGSVTVNLGSAPTTSTPSSYSQTVNTPGYYQMLGYFYEATPYSCLEDSGVSAFYQTMQSYLTNRNFTPESSYFVSLFEFETLRNITYGGYAENSALQFTGTEFARPEHADFSEYLIDFVSSETVAGLTVPSMPISLGDLVGALINSSRDTVQNAVTQIVTDLRNDAANVIKAALWGIDFFCGDAISHWKKVYTDMQGTGSGGILSFYTASMTVVADTMGVVDLSNAVTGEDLYSGQTLRTHERVFAGLTGTLSLVTSVTGVASGGLNAVRSGIRASGGCKTTAGKLFSNCCFTTGTQVLVAQGETVTPSVIQRTATEVRYHQEINEGAFLVTLVFGASAVVLRTAEKKRQWRQKMEQKHLRNLEQEHLKNLFTNPEVEPIDMDNDMNKDTLEQIAANRMAFQEFWSESPEPDVEELFLELETVKQPAGESVTVKPKKKEYTKSQSTSWFGYTSILFFILAIISLLCPLLLSYNQAEDVSPVAPAPVVETKYITKNIEDIQAGDEVLAYDVQTGETVRREVVSTVHLKCDHLRYLTVRDDKGAEQTFQTTDTHPFWVNTDRPEQYRKARDSVSEHDVSTNTDIPFGHEDLIVTENGFYVEAKDLKIGDNFIGPNGEVSFLVQTWREAHPEGIDVYNINVADNSNYFVIANYADFQKGNHPILVHNAKCDSSYKYYESQQLAIEIGIDSSKIHTIKKKIRAEANKIDDVRKELKKMGDNPDILLSGRRIGLKSRINPKMTVDTTLNIDDILKKYKHLL
ncbi:MAG: hypothetical protein IKW74_08040, partial [Thermoguttaceae bacterium]|nr:hypothetical protein [Thermoguttaceae bacterium]